MNTDNPGVLPEIDAPPLRLAVYGWVQDGGGSVASAHHALCAALLTAGHRLDLFASGGFVPDPGYRSDTFTYIPVGRQVRPGLRLPGYPAAVRPLVERLDGMRSTHRYLDNAMAATLTRHAERPYNAMLFLGTVPRATLPGVPGVVWAQCAPQNELRAVRGLLAPVRRVSGIGAYLRVRLYYEVKDHLVWGWARRHHLVLASRRAAEDAVRFGVAVERICVAPYAIDLDRFAPRSIPTGAQRRVLCVGRLDPRKRIDLLVDAVALLAQRRNDFHVEVIGRDGYIPGWADFVERASRNLPLTYTPAVAQSEIVRRLHEADVLVQPSEREEFGHAVAEALACGVPVVTGPTNGTGEYVPEASSAKFDRYDPASLADAIERALAVSRSPAAREACRAAAEVFSADRVAARLVSHIREAQA
jgi:glycosyltransferase involved in cell wall biosynthesis